jgi:hypothetical protein
MPRRHAVAAILALAAALSWAQGVHALGMRVSPAGMLIQGVVPGERLELSVPLAIMNDDDQVHGVLVSALRPLDQKMKPPSGYTDIPDPSWVSFSQPEVDVPANGQASLKIILNIPAGEKYFNQHWSVVAAIRSKPTPGQMISLALYPRFEIETAPLAVKPDSGIWPLGALVITPGTRTVELARLGGSPVSAPLTVWNGTGAAWQGEIVFIADSGAAKRERLDMSGGWRWLPDASWIKCRNASLQVGPHRTEEILVEVGVPEGKENHGGAWEVIALLKGRDGSSAVARLRIVAPQGEPQPAAPQK